MGMIQEFKKFALRGNVMDMAVGIIIGAAFGTVVKSLVDDIIMPPIGVVTSGVDFKSLSYRIEAGRNDPASGKVSKPAQVLNYGQFINNVISFLIVAFAVFMMVKMMNAAETKLSLGLQPDAPPPPEDVLLLREIRDELKKRLSLISLPCKGVVSVSKIAQCATEDSPGHWPGAKYRRERLACRLIEEGLHQVFGYDWAGADEHFGGGYAGGAAEVAVGGVDAIEQVFLLRRELRFVATDRGHFFGERAADIDDDLAAGMGAAASGGPSMQYSCRGSCGAANGRIGRPTW